MEHIPFIQEQYYKFKPKRNMFQNFKNDIISYRNKFRKPGTILTFMNNISAHKNTLRAKRNIFHLIRKKR